MKATGCSSPSRTRKMRRSVSAGSPSSPTMKSSSFFPLAASVLRPGVHAAEHPQVLALLAVGDEPGDARAHEDLVPPREGEVAGRVVEDVREDVAGHEPFDVLPAGGADRVAGRVADVAQGA